MVFTGSSWFSTVFELLNLTNCQFQIHSTPKQFIPQAEIKSICRIPGEFGVINPAARVQGRSVMGSPHPMTKTPKMQVVK